MARGRRGRAGLVRRHPARRAAAGVPRRLGPARRGPRRGRRDPVRRLGARRRRRCSARRWRGCTGSPTGWSGCNPRAGRPGFAPLAGGHGRGVAVRGRLRLRAQPGGAGTAGRGWSPGWRCAVRDVLGDAAVLVRRRRAVRAGHASSARSQRAPRPRRGDGGRARRRGRSAACPAAASRARSTSWPGRARRRAAACCRPTASATRTRSRSG